MNIRVNRHKVYINLTRMKGIFCQYQPTYIHGIRQTYIDSQLIDGMTFVWKTFTVCLFLSHPSQFYHWCHLPDMAKRNNILKFFSKSPTQKFLEGFEGWFLMSINNISNFKLKILRQTVLLLFEKKLYRILDSNLYLVQSWRKHFYSFKMPDPNIYLGDSPRHNFNKQW